MKIYLFLLIVLSIPAMAFSASPTVTKFSAMSDVIRLPPDELLGKAPKKLTVEVPAIVFKPPIVIKNLRDNIKYAYEEINVFKNYFKTYYYGTKEQILSYWTPEDRPGILKHLNDKEFFEADRKLYQESPRSKTILAIVYQKDTASVFYNVVENYKDIKNTASSVVMNKINGRYFLTNHSPDDFQLSVIESSLSHWKGKR